MDEIPACERCRARYTFTNCGLPRIPVGRINSTRTAGVVPLGQDADQRLIVEYEYGSDVLLGHHLEGVIGGVARPDEKDVAPLLANDAGNCSLQSDHLAAPNLPSSVRARP